MRKENTVWTVHAGHLGLGERWLSVATTADPGTALGALWAPGGRRGSEARSHAACTQPENVGFGVGDDLVWFWN